MKMNLPESVRNVSTHQAKSLSPVSLLLPQSDLVSDGGRDVGRHLVGGHHVHVEESDDLVGCDAPPEVRVTAVYNYLHISVRFFHINFTRLFNISISSAC